MMIENLQKLQNKVVEVTGFEDAATAKAAVSEGIELYDKKFGNK